MIQTTVAPPVLFRMVELKSSYIFEKKIIFWYQDNILRLRCYQCNEDSNDHSTTLSFRESRPARFNQTWIESVVSIELKK